MNSAADIDDIEAAAILENEISLLNEKLKNLIV